MNAAQSILILGVRLYRWTISPAKQFIFGPLAGCRFHPSCSEYALEAVRTRGALTGTWLALKRIWRCHPWGGCGEDPVPPRKSEVRPSSVALRRVESPKCESQTGQTSRTGPTERTHHVPRTMRYPSLQHSITPSLHFH